MFSTLHNKNSWIIGWELNYPSMWPKVHRQLCFFSFSPLLVWWAYNQAGWHIIYLIGLVKSNSAIPQLKKKKRDDAVAGDRTRVTRVTGGNTHHYTTTTCWHVLSLLSLLSNGFGQSILIIFTSLRKSILIM